MTLQGACHRGHTSRGCNEDRCIRNVGRAHAHRQQCDRLHEREMIEGSCGHADCQRACVDKWERHRRRRRRCPLCHEGLERVRDVDSRLAGVEGRNERGCEVCKRVEGLCRLRLLHTLR